jgi:hypothetical protein
MTHRHGRETSPGFADPLSPVGAGQATRRGSALDGEVPPGVKPVPAAIAVNAPLPAERRPDAPAPAARPKTQIVDVEVTHEHGPAPRADPTRHAFEVWTQNHVYMLDARLTCLDVRSRSESGHKRDHPMVGARLVGGQLQQNESIEMSYPLPRPGSLAVFEVKKGKRRQYPRTSPVERVVMRLHISTITGSGQVPSWDDVAGD